MFVIWLEVIIDYRLSIITLSKRIFFVNSYSNESSWDLSIFYFLNSIIDAIARMYPSRLKNIQVPSLAISRFQSPLKALKLKQENL
jgi:hypothetical protein